MNALLKTQRLYLRNLELSDVDTIFSYRNDKTCAVYQRWEDISWEAIARYVQKYENSRFLSEEEEQHYAVCTQEGIMTGELSCFVNREDVCVTLGITIVPSYQRRGFAREILAAVIQAVQENDPALDIVALIDPENRASIGLFEVLGFVRECYAESIDSYVYVIYGSGKPGI